MTSTVLRVARPPFAIILTLLSLLTLPGGLMAASGTVDVRVLVDVSERMNTADPEGIRASAVELLLQMLPESGYAGVWTYAGAVNMLVPHGRSDRLWKTQAALKVEHLPAVGANANPGNALAEATWDRAAQSDRDRHLILISDGGIRTGSGEAADSVAERQLLREQVPALLTAGFKLHVLALPGSDHLLRAMSEKSGGLYQEVADLQNLRESVLLLLDTILQSGQLPVAGDHGFLVDPGLEAVNVLRLRRSADDDLTLMAPDGRAYTRLTANVGFRWYVGADFDLVSIDNPPPGRWFFSPDTGQSSRVIATGNLRPVLQGLPAMVFPGELKSFRLDLAGHNGIPITDSDFLNLLDVDAALVSSDLVQPLSLERHPDGYLQLQMLAPDKQGDYAVRIRVSGPTFERISEVPFSIRNPISLRVVPAADGGLIWLAINAGEISPELTRVSAVITRPMQGARTLEAERFPGGLWKIGLNDQPGVVEVAIDIDGKQLNGNNFTIQMKPVVVTLPVTMGRGFNFDLRGAEISTGALVVPLAEDAAAAPGSLSAGLPALTAEPAASPVQAPELPLWFAAALAPVNLLLGFAVFLLLAPPAGARDFLARVRALEEMLPAAEAEAA
jgi:hypothetical protein